jgi:hypothetical protein
VSTHFSLMSFFNCMSAILTFLCLISFLVISLNILGQSLPEILMQEMAPNPRGEEHAIIVSSKFINY